MKRSVIIVMALFLSLPAWGQIRWPWQKAQPAKPAPAASRPVGPAVNKPPMPAPAPVVAPAPAAKTAPQPVKTTPPAAAKTAKTPAPVAGRGTAAPARGGTNPQPVNHARRTQQAEHRRVAVKSSKPAKDKPKPEPGTYTGKGQRDPFVSPVIEHVRGGPTCKGTGRQCLEVGEITLNGIVRSSSGTIAVVSTGEHTYFLHVNDPLANGSVERINRDSIVLREHYQDDFGHQASREVTRKLGTPAG
jgi:Tfp pilus assembly protein PilP